MKTARVTLLTSPDFKKFLSVEAQREGVSVAELIRSRCERRPSDDEKILMALTGELNKAVMSAKMSLKSGLDEAQEVLSALRDKRTEIKAAAGAAPRAPRRQAVGTRR